MIVNCPHCRGQINADGAVVGDVACPHCGGRLRLPKPRPPVPAIVVEPVREQPAKTAGRGWVVLGLYVVAWLGIAWIAASILGGIAVAGMSWVAKGVDLSSIPESEKVQTTVREIVYMFVMQGVAFVPFIFGAFALASLFRKTPRD